MSFAARLPESAPQAWAAARGHPFVDAMAAGVLPEDAFARWIGQDRLFVRGLRRWLDGLIAAAPETDREGLSAGRAALEPELALFDDYARRSGVELEAAPNDACRAYLRFLDVSLRAGYPSALTAYYGCEVAYLEAWTAVRDRAAAGGRYADWIANWSSDGFRAYVGWLGDRLDAIAIGLSDAELDGLRGVFASTVELEVAFWDACWGA